MSVLIGEYIKGIYGRCPSLSPIVKGATHFHMPNTRPGTSASHLHGQLFTIALPYTFMLNCTAKGLNHDDSRKKEIDASFEQTAN
jgi:hypothetical protein